MSKVIWHRPWQHNFRTASHFIREFKQRHPESTYFDKETLAFFGESIAEMRVLPQFVMAGNWQGELKKCYCLTSIQHNAPGGPMHSRHYFDAETMGHVLVWEEE